ncbi:hypothetical protein BC828DRAFT_408689 [Blastocladiella britannica]|nr:hypothetical protein BC828DRAFT_408689 [Blastocladiella britannica]
MIDDIANLILEWTAGATHSTTEVVAVLNVLPRNKAVLAAALSRGFVSAAQSADLPLSWRRTRWDTCAANGHVQTLLWGLERGYLKRLTARLALLSARTGNLTLVARWLSSQKSPTAAINALKHDMAYPQFLQCRSVATLDWWWIHVANESELPWSFALDEIVGNALCGTDTILEWWWARFLAHRAPGRQFGSLELIESRGWEFSPQGAEWLWQHAHRSGTHWDGSLNAFGFAPDWHDVALSRLPWSIKVNVVVLRWWIDKWTTVLEMNDTITPALIGECVSVGDLRTLDAILCARDSIQVDWGDGLVIRALNHGRLDVLTWWEAHHDQLPPQNLDCDLALWHSAHWDTADVLEWCYTRFSSAISKENWQTACEFAILHNAQNVQQWLLAHPDLLGDVTITDTFSPTLHTLDFLTAVGPTLDPLPLTDATLAIWQCLRSGTSIASHLPLSPEQWASVLDGEDLMVYEWWLRAHLAADLVPMFPDVETIQTIMESGSDEDIRIWLDNVMIARKIPLLMQSKEDPDALVPLKWPS